MKRRGGAEEEKGSTRKAADTPTAWRSKDLCVSWDLSGHHVMKPYLRHLAGTLTEMAVLG